MRRIKIFLRAVATGVAVAAISGTAHAGDMAYMGTNAGDFGTIDFSTGVFSRLGSFGQTLAGFGVVGGKVFGSSYHTTGQLFQVNLVDGTLTLIGNSGITFDTFGSTPTGGLFGVGTDANLYSISSSTGAATLVGAIGLGLGSGRSLSTDAMSLYFDNGTSFYSLDTATGAATFIGNTGGPFFGAIVYEHGVLYGGTNLPTVRVGTIDSTSGLGTLGEPLTGTSGNFFALAPMVPEPGTWTLSALGLATIFAARRRSR